jgi:hypothetical protein
MTSNHQHSIPYCPQSIGEPEHAPLPIQAKEMPSLNEILFTQGAEGQFRLDDFGLLSNALSQKYRTKVLEGFLVSVFKDDYGSARRDTEIMILRFNILVVIYITDQYAASKDLWELQIAKARQWIKQKMTELAKDKSDLEKVSEISLEELERDIITELNEKDSQRGRGSERRMADF